jgi:hypothetical protein
MHNESMAEKITEGRASTGNGKPALGVEVTMSPFATKLSIAAMGILLGAMIGKRFNARPIVVKGAQKVQDVAEQAEEAAARG